MEVYAGIQNKTSFEFSERGPSHVDDKELMDIYTVENCQSGTLINHDHPDISKLDESEVRTGVTISKRGQISVNIRVYSQAPLTGPYKKFTQKFLRSKNNQLA